MQEGYYYYWIINKNLGPCGKSRVHKTGLLYTNTEGGFCYVVKATSLEDGKHVAMAKHIAYLLGGKHES